MWQSALVHPMERLRYVARAGGVDQFALAREAADALGSLWGEPAELVNACRRMVHHHPLAGSLGDGEQGADRNRSPRGCIRLC